MKYFENAEMEVISFNVADVITTSGDEEGFDSPLDFANGVPDGNSYNG